MRFTPKELHPSIFEAFHAWQARAMVLMSSADGDTKVNSVETYTKHQKVWWREYGNAVTMGLVGYLGGGVGLLITADKLNNPVFGAVAGALLIGGLAHATIGYYKNRGLVTLEELESLLPALELSTTQRGYAQVFVSLHRAKTVDGETRTEILEQINRLMDDAIRLEQHRTSLYEQIGNADGRANILAEVESIRTKVGSVQDEEAKAAFERSLQIAEMRLARFSDSSPLIERADAQLELINQTLAALGEVLATYGPRTIPEFDIKSLRERVMMIQSQSSAIDSAIKEIHAM